MGLQVIRLGTNEDGTPQYHYEAPGEHVVITGPATGNVTLPDGTVVDVTAPVILADSQEHAIQIANAIAGEQPVVDAPVPTEPPVQ
jgi:hypothetical protein